MSIIYDALKKTESVIESISQPKAGENQEKPASKPKLAALYLLIVLFGIAMANLVFAWLNRPPKQITMKPPAVISLAPKAETASNKESESVSTPAKPLPEEPSPKKIFVLNGIFFSKDEGYALINNNIVRIGDSVEGAKVLRITPAGVELSQEGKTIRLTLNSSR